MKILFLSRWFPYPSNNGSKLRVAGLLGGLGKQHDVTLVSFIDPTEASQDAPVLRSICSDVQVVPWREFNPQSRRARLGFLSASPRFILDTYSSQMDQVIRNSVSKNRFDLVIASQLPMASYYQCFQNLPALFEEVELGSFHPETAPIKSSLGRGRMYLTWFKLQGYLRRLLKAYRTCTVVSKQEYQLFWRTFPSHQHKVKTIPNFIHEDQYQKIKNIPTIGRMIFSGSFRYGANHEAMVWFIREVYPRILRQVPEAELVITGDHANLSLPPAPNVRLTGYVEDIASEVAASQVSLAPLLRGGGTRLKILEAMAIGIPVVATSKGAEGLEAIPGEHILIADGPEAFAQHVISVIQEKRLHMRLSANGKQFIKENYSSEIILPRFLELVEQAAA